MRFSPGTDFLPFPGSEPARNDVSFGIPHATLPMLTPLSALQAFRQDLAANPDAATDDDARWLQVVSLLQSATDVHPADRGPILNAVADLAAADAPPGPDGSVTLPVTLAAAPPRALHLAIGAGLAMEDATRLRLAYSAYDALLRLIVAGIEDGAARADVQGLLLGLQGRVARQLGDLTAARERYEAAEHVGKAHDNGASVARAWVGYGMMAQVRGNMPEARNWFRQVLDCRGAGRESLQVAHQALLVAASAAADFDEAARHGWAAYELAADDEDASAALCDLSELMRVSGRPALALRGFSAALLRAPRAPRRRLAALGGAILAAAQAIPPAQAAPILARYKAEIDGIIASTNLPYVHATALADMGDAFALLGNAELCEDARARAKFIARAHGFYELLFRVTDDAIPVAGRDVLPVHPAAARAPARHAMDDAAPVLSAIAAFSAPPEIEAALAAST